MTETFKAVSTILIFNIIHLFLVILNFTFHNLYLSLQSVRVSPMMNQPRIQLVFQAQFLLLFVRFQHFNIFLSCLTMSLKDIYVLRKLSTYFLIKFNLFCAMKRIFFCCRGVCGGKGLVYIWQAIQVCLYLERSA